MLVLQTCPEHLYNRQLFGIDPRRDNRSEDIVRRELVDQSCRVLISREAVSIKIDLAKDLCHILSILEDHRAKDRGLAVYSLAISASDAG